MEERSLLEYRQQGKSRIINSKEKDLRLRGETAIYREKGRPNTEGEGGKGS